MSSRRVPADVSRTVKLNELGSYLSTLSFPAERADVVAACEDVTLRLADGEANLARVVGGSSTPRFETAADLADEVYMLLPRRAVGEPFQSEGDA
jgi:hypothetical protein